MCHDRVRFIALEGPEACGKSTQIQQLEKRLRGLGFSVVVVREPGGTLLGEAVRELFRHTPVAKTIVARAELLLFAAARAQLVEEVIRPALERGAWVVTDRFSESSLVYQGTVRGLPWSEVNMVNRWATQGLLPSLTLVLDLPISELRKRLIARKDHGNDQMEEEFAGHLEEIRKGYLTLAREEPERIRVVEAHGSPEELGQKIWEVVCDAFCLR
ncbi:dTMP kinase [Candidatus Methylacidithermus pantelleriae]|uniref:Thymidylate kinase n=1 Tax=Candidatus Methylacidithermus pantelleriae TaxID=2744239 RepID=A0A8J2FS22_9BACT|nr:dTMP kinase [Candidatus Methylacidithermus pantelleriae]CAF0692963.1 Thymidylate kinase [Candidatus Methylacidithermus pantelleriae]